MGTARAPLRQAVTAYAGLPLNAEVSKIDLAPLAAEDLPGTESGEPSPAASRWAMLIARIYEILPWQFVVDSGGELKIVAFLIEADPVRRILICLSVNRPHRLELRLLAHHRTGSKRISIKRFSTNRKTSNRLQNLTNRQDRRFARRSRPQGRAQGCAR
ncbi:MAG: hypothetical protein ACRESZ_12950 [Methylococcales bacterium]